MRSNSSGVSIDRANVGIVDVALNMDDDRPAAASFCRPRVAAGTRCPQPAIRLSCRPGETPMLKKIALAAALSLAAADAHAQAFYAGKQVTLLVNYDAGGPTDIEARVFARHIGKHIAGNPHIIVQNMGGAAGLIGTKYLGEVAPKDGSVLGYFTGSTQRY